MRPVLRWVVAWCAFVGSFALPFAARPAAAGGPYIQNAAYKVSQVSGRYTSPPSDATKLSLGLDEYTRVAMPFVLDYYGSAFDKVWVASNGVCTFNANFATWVANNKVMGPMRGTVAVLWDSINPKDQGGIYTWTAGTAPNRTFVVSWEGVAAGDQQYAGNLTFQVQFAEGSNRIIFAYKPDTSPSTWPTMSYSCGIEAQGWSVWAPGETGVSWDQRYSEPFGRRADLTGHPGTDLEFVPTDFVSVKGSLVFDRVSSDASGLGNANTTDAPLGGVRIVATQPDGLEIGSAVTEPDGTFDLRLFGPPVQQPFVAAVAANDACTVRTDAASAAVSRLLFYQSYLHADADVGTFRISQAIDGPGALRGAFAVASAIDVASDFASDFASAWVDAPAALDVFYDTSSSASTGYTPASGNTAASLRVGSAASGNEDAWDAGVVVRAWSRHLIQAIAGGQASQADDRFDVETEPKNAFASAFGCYLYAASSGTSTLVDASGKSTATTIDLEDPKPTTAKGPRVTAWVAAALFDVLDADNESHDRMDGVAHPERVLRCVDTVKGTPDAATFYDAWVASGGSENLALSRNFIAHGLLPDDAREPNDDGGEATSAGAVPVLRRAGTLLPLNEDWFEFTLPATVPTLRIDAWFNRIGQDATMTLEVRTTAGALVVAGAPLASPGPWRAVAAPLAAGTYRVRMRHDSGPAVDPYTLQVYEPLQIADHPPLAWTEGRPFDRAIGARGGVPPWTLSADPPSAKPKGILFSKDGDRVVGTPTEAGTYQMALRLDDSGDPAHTATSSQPFVVNPPLAVDLGEFVPFPVGRAGEIGRPGAGGTPPLAFDVAEGTLPEGITLDPASLSIGGTAAAPGSALVRIHGIDVAGSEDGRDVTVVGCVPLGAKNGDVELADGASACGYWVDAVAGSTVKAVVATAPRQAKRTLRAVWIGPDGRVIDTKKLTGGKGRAKAAGLPCPASGRYFLVLASSDGPATVLRASGSDAPPARASGRIDAFAAASPQTFEIGAIAPAKFDLVLTPDPKSKLRVALSFVTSPSGAQVPLAGVVPDKKGVVRFSTTLGESGTWKVVVASAPGTDGRLSWSMKLHQPKGTEYSAD